MRFGLHLADVVRVGDDLRGDGVNTASRLQKMAEPGEIDVSAALFNHVRRVSPCAFEDMGENRLKGLDEAIHIMRVGASVDRHGFQLAPKIETPRTKTKPNSIAVLPFITSRLADEDQEFRAEGLSEDLIHNMSLIRSLFVIFRTASVALQTDDSKVIGDTLGVRYVLSGSVLKMGSRVRLS